MEANCTDGTVWIVRDTFHSFEYQVAADKQAATALEAKLNRKVERERRKAEIAAEARAALAANAAESAKAGSHEQDAEAEPKIVEAAE